MDIYCHTQRRERGVLSRKRDTPRSFHAPCRPIYVICFDCLMRETLLFPVLNFDSIRFDAIFPWHCCCTDKGRT